MLEGLVRALVLAHPPQESESPQPDARDLAVLRGVLQLPLLQGADRIEHQGEAEHAQADQDPVEEHQGLHHADGVVLVVALHALPEDPQAAEYVPTDLRQQQRYPATHAYEFPIFSGRSIDGLTVKSIYTRAINFCWANRI